MSLGKNKVYYKYYRIKLDKNYIFSRIRQFIYLKIDLYENIYDTNIYFAKFFYIYTFRKRNNQIS